MTLAAVNECSVLTPPGAGAIALIRVTGPDAESIVGRLFFPRVGPSGCPPAPRLRYGDLRDAQGETIDDVLVSTSGPPERTAVIISSHGGIRVVERILSALDGGGAKLRSETDSVAELWAPVDLIEADAWSALASAKTARAVRFLALQRQVLPCALDRVARTMTGDPIRARYMLTELRDRARPAMTLVHGAAVTLIGPPNVGKSTLMNRLAGRTVAVASPTAGTTRDYVTAEVELEGVPVTLTDTAGVRPTEDALERRAIDAGRARRIRASVVVLLLDGSRRPDPSERRFLETIVPNQPVIIGLNKCDDPDSNLADFRALIRPEWTVVSLSARTGAGIGRLSEAIVHRLGLEPGIEEAPAFFCMRQVMRCSDILAVPERSPADAAQAVIAELWGRRLEPPAAARLE